jgi:GNAT superfamily N-acetyltransferase
MNEIRFAVGDADPGLRDRLDEEINAFNAAATGYDDGRMLSVAVRGDDGDLRAGLYGWTWGGCGYIDLLWVRDDQRGSGLGTRLLAAAEAEIRHRGCDRVALNTPAWRARKVTLIDFLVTPQISFQPCVPISRIGVFCRGMS